MNIVITGANRGIGLGLTESYRAAGHSVIGTSRSSGPGLEQLDVRDPASHKDLAHRLEGQPIDLLICNAGIYADKGNALDTGFAASTWADTFATNVTGVFLTVQALLPNLKAARGRIAIISSQMGSSARAHGGSYAYRSSKAAALNLGRNLATDLAADGIAVGIYHPGWVVTDMGGSAADIDVATSVAGLIARFEALTPESSGEFRSYDGTALLY